MPTPRPAVVTTNITSLANEERPKSLEKNIYKIDSPYDLNTDIITRSINLLNQITGFDYRTNTIVDIVERLVDAQNSDLLQIGATRLLAEFGRRSVYNLLDGFIPAPNDFLPNFQGSFKKHDRSITDPNKNPKRTFADRALEGTIGYRSNDNYLLTFASESNLGDYKYSSDIYFYYSGKLIQEKIKNLGYLNTFSTYSDKSIVDYSIQSKTFKNTYDSNWLNIEGLTEFYRFKDINYYTHTYFTLYKKTSNRLTKDYILETKNLEVRNGFGNLSTKQIDIKKNIGLKDAVIFENKNDVTGQFTERQKYYEDSDGSFIYDSDSAVQETILSDHRVKRGLIYFTSKLAEENNLIAQNKKELYTDTNSNPNVVYYKGNGECRTFTIYEQYDNFSKLIRFNGNNEKNSVLKDSVMPKIAPYVGDTIDDRRNHFFTMENLAVKVTNDNDGDQGPNGGKWIWFPPYDVKISDNNQVNWSDMNFLGRPEPIFSYQNTTRSLSLTFRLLIDTVKEMQDLKPTIENYRAFLYNCGEYQFDEDEYIDDKQETDKKENDKVKKQKAETKFINAPAQYFFKNALFEVKTSNIDYTSGDNCLDTNELGELNTETVSELSSSTLGYNEPFLSSISAATEQLKELIDSGSVEKIEIDIEGSSTDLIAKKDRGSTKARNYNRNLSWSRAYGFMSQFIVYYNISATNTIPPPSPLNIEPNEDKSLPGQEVYKISDISDVTIIFNLKPKGDSYSNGSTYKKRNDPNEISDRFAKMKGFKVTFNEKANTPKTTPDIDPELNTDAQDKIRQGDFTKIIGQNNDPILNLKFQKLKENHKFPTGFERLNPFTPVFNSQTPFDFTKRYVFLHQLTRPSRLRNSNSIENTVFGRMPVFVLRYGDFLHTKAIARSINFDISESTWDLNPEGMGAIPLYCTVTMDLTLLGGQSLAGPIDRIQTASDSSFIANTSFNTGRYNKNVRFASSRNEEGYQYKGKGSGQDKTEVKTKSNSSTPPPTTQQTNTPIQQSLLFVPKVQIQDIPIPRIKLGQFEGNVNSLDSIDLPLTKEQLEKQQQENISAEQYENNLKNAKEAFSNQMGEETRGIVKIEPFRPL